MRHRVTRTTDEALRDVASARLLTARSLPIGEVGRMKPLHLILLVIPLGVAFRYCVELTQAARLIGIAISSPAYLSMNKNGFQGAVTPPESNKWFYLTMALLMGAVGWLWAAFGW